MKRETSIISLFDVESIWAKTVLVVAAACAYVLAFFPLYPPMGPVAGVLALIPVVAAAWLWGLPAGLIAGLMSFPLNTLLLNLVGHQPGGWDVMIRRGSIPGTAALVLVGVAVGRLRDLGEQVKRQLADRKRAEEALRKSEERYHAIVENQTELICRWLPDGTITFVNEAYCRYFGKRPDELIGLSFTPPIPDEDREAFEKYMASLGRESSEGTIEHRIIMPSGEIRWHQWNDRALFDGRGHLVEFQSVGRDVTELKRAEEALRKSEEKYRSLFERSKDVVYISTPDGKLLDVNPAGVELVGYSSKEELLKVDIAQDLYFNPQDREMFKRTLMQQGFVKDLELVLKRKDGKKLFVLETTSAVRDEKGNVVAYWGVIRDVTEQRRLEGQLIQAQKMEAVGMLAGGVAHDFNNILQAILGNAEMGLLKVGPSHPLYVDLSQIAEAAGRGAELIGRLLAFSRRQVLQRKVIDLNDLVLDSSKMLSRLIPESITLRVVPGAKSSIVFADPTGLGQVLMNLAVNARDAMPGGGKLEIETTSVTLDGTYSQRHPDVKPGEYACLSVKDTGLGMDEETLGRIFEPFFTTKEVGKGYGLGLSVVWGIVKGHGGHIEITSQPGQGTTFRVYLPIHGAQAQKAAATKGELVAGGRETILVAEDEKSLRELAQRMLEGLGYRVLLAADGVEAIELFAADRGRIDLVILDVVMPKLGGAETYERLRALSPDVPILFVTGYGAEVAEGDMFHETPLHRPVLQKPFTRGMLGRKVRELLDRAK